MAHINRGWSHSARKARAGVSQVVRHALNSTYPDSSSQILWENGERVFHRDWRLDDDGKRRAVLLVASAAEGLPLVAGV